MDYCKGLAGSNRTIDEVLHVVGARFLATAGLVLGLRMVDDFSIGLQPILNGKKAVQSFAAY